MRAKATLILISILFALIAFTNANAIKVQSTEQTIVKSEVRDLGWVTYAHSEQSIYIENETETSVETEAGEMEMSYRYSLENTWDINASCGASLPVNLTIITPSNATPGENITVLIGLFSEMGYIFYTLIGEHYLELQNEYEMSQEIGGVSSEYDYYFYLALLNQYMLNWSKDLETPIGNVTITFENVTVHLGEFSLELEMEYEINNETMASEEVEVEASVDVYLNFDIIVIANTSVIGTVNITGTATKPEEIYLVWNEEGWKDVIIPIGANATANDSLSIDVALRYVVDTFSIIYEDIDLIISVNEASIENEVEGFVNDTQITLKIEELLERTLQEYITGEHAIPFNITGTELIKGQSLGVKTEDSNTIVSDSPYDEFLAFYLQIAVSVTSAPSNGGGEPVIEFPELSGFEFTLIIVSMFATIIVASYALLRRNRRG